MSFSFNLYRFGMDEFAVGHLINGDFPEDDEQRWNIMQAPEYHIRRMLNEHRRAQDMVDRCTQDGKPFVLYLRSFSAEFSGVREGTNVVGSVSLKSMRFQDWLRRYLERDDTPLIRLHGGSDGFHSGDDDVCVLSTHAENWESVAAELVANAGVIVFLLSDLNPGVRTEIDRIRALGRSEQCLIAIPPEDEESADDELLPKLGGATTPRAPRPDVRRYVADFPHVFKLSKDDYEASYPAGFDTALQDILHAAGPVAACPETLAARFTYLERDFVESEEYARTQQRIWALMHELRVLADDAYWAALQEYGVSIRHLQFDNAWKAAHEIYGLAIAAGDFHAIAEILDHLFKLYGRRNADLAFAVPALAARYRELSDLILGGPPIDTEAIFGDGRDLMSFPVKVPTVLQLQKLARMEKDPGLAGLMHFASLIYALKSGGGDINPRWLAAHIANDWSAFQFDNGLGHWGIANLELSAALFRQLADETPETHQQELGRALTNLGKRYSDTGDVEAAEAAYREALEIRRGVGTVSTEARVNLYNALANLGWLLGATGREEEATGLLDEAVAECRAHAAAQLEAEADLVRLLGWRASVLVRMPDRAAEAAAALEEAEMVLAAAEVDEGMQAALTALIARVREEMSEQDR